MYSCARFYRGGCVGRYSGRVADGDRRCRSEHEEKPRTFQVLIHPRNDIAAGDFDVDLRYQRCEWTTGDASGGSGGFGGTPASAGFNSGNGVTGLALPGSSTGGVLMLCTGSNVGQPGVWSYRVRGGTVMP